MSSPPADDGLSHLQDDPFWEPAPEAPAPVARKKYVNAKKASKGISAKSLYRHEYAPQAERMCLLLGASDQDLAEFFEVKPATIKHWRQRHPSFNAALRRGRLQADAEVAECIFKQAKGTATIKRTKVLQYKDGTHEVVEYEEALPPNTDAGKFWLTRRQREKWGDTKVQHVGNLDEMTDEELAALAEGRAPKK